MGAPSKPSELEMQNIKFLRFVDPEDTTKIIQVALKDTGLTAGDGTPIYALMVDSGEFGAKTSTTYYEASLPPGATVQGAGKELANNKGIAFTVNVQFHASSTAGVEVWLESSNDGTNWDTDKFVTGLEPTYVANQTKQKTTLVDSLPKYLRAVIKNLDATYSHPVSIKGITVE